MQPPTCTGLRIRSVHDAEIILHAVALKLLPMVTRRLDDEERLYLKSGCIYVWEERSNNPLEATGQEIQRFTEGRSWGPSRARDDFLLYYEKESESRSSLLLRNNLTGSSQLIKQTYSVLVRLPDAPPRKWHLNAYYTQDTADQLRTVDQLRELRYIQVPEGRYICARTSSARRSNRGSQAAGYRANYRYSSSPSDISPTTPGPSFGLAISGDPSGAVSPSLMGPASHYLSTSPASPHPSHRLLAPLEYLQTISPPARDPVDDEALRSFHKKI